MHTELENLSGTGRDAHQSRAVARSAWSPRTYPGVLPPLDSRHEREALEEIRELEIDRWRAVLLRPDGNTRPDESSKRRSRARLERKARAMYAEDIDRTLIENAHRCAIRPRSNPTAEARSQVAKVRATARDVEAARHRFVRANLALVIAIVRNCRRGQMPFEDLIHEGIVGLVRALNRFDVDQGVRFSTYAVWWIRQAISRAIEHQSQMIRLPANLSLAQRKIRFAEARGEASEGRAPDDGDLLRETGVSAGQLELLRRRGVTGTLSIDAEPDDDFGSYHKLQLADDSGRSPYEATLARTFANKVDDLLETLSPMERAVVDARFGLSDRSEGVTLREIGETFDLSRERIRQIQNDALGKLRDQLEQPNN
jgi:RNA polymerase primary sigma factor